MYIYRVCVYRSALTVNCDSLTLQALDLSFQLDTNTIETL